MHGIILLPDATSFDNLLCYMPINDIPFELFVFLPADPENRINELRFSESISLSYHVHVLQLIFLLGWKPNFYYDTLQIKVAAL